MSYNMCAKNAISSNQQRSDTMTDAQGPQLVHTLPDAELADDFRRRLVGLMAPACKLINEAREVGLVVSVQPVWDQLGRVVVTPAQVQIVKHY